MFQTTVMPSPGGFPFFLTRGIAPPPPAAAFCTFNPIIPKGGSLRPFAQCITKYVAVRRRVGRRRDLVRANVHSIVVADDPDGAFPIRPGGVGECFDLSGKAYSEEPRAL